MIVKRQRVYFRSQNYADNKDCSMIRTLSKQIQVVISGYRLQVIMSLVIGLDGVNIEHITEILFQFNVIVNA